jgi:hypothetical protein
VTYQCTEPRCRWAAFNGTHPNLIHAVWWGCTRRTSAPFRPGDVVTYVDVPEIPPTPVKGCHWDGGTGWHVELEPNSAYHTPDRFRLVAAAAGHTQPALFDLLEATP